MPCIPIVEDRHYEAEQIKVQLEENGMEAVLAHTVTQGMKLAPSVPPT